MALYNVGVFPHSYVVPNRGKLCGKFDQSLQFNLPNILYEIIINFFITEKAELEFATVCFAKYNLGGYVPKFTFSTVFL